MNVKKTKSSKKIVLKITMSMTPPKPNRTARFHQRKNPSHEGWAGPVEVPGAFKRERVGFLVVQDK